MADINSSDIFSKLVVICAKLTIALITVGHLLLFEQTMAGSTKPTTVDLEIIKRNVTASNNTIRFSQGDQVKIRWKTDETVKLHLHGYDIKATAQPGQSVSMNFLAHTAGRFPVTAHDFGHSTMIYLEIYPR
jgi:hypothetical protein